LPNNRYLDKPKYVKFLGHHGLTSTFVVAADSFLDMHTARNIAKPYDGIIESFKLTSKVTKIVSDNASYVRFSSFPSRVHLV